MADVRVLVLDLAGVLRIVRTAAVARALSDSAKLEWKTYDDSTFLNVAYGIMRWKAKPGWVEVDIAGGPELDKRTERYAFEDLARFFTRAAEGPVALHTFLESLQRRRADCLRHIDDVFHEARVINGDVEAETRSAIRALSTIRLAAAVAVPVIGAGATLAIMGGATALTLGGATIGFGGTAGAFGAVGTASSVSCSLIKEWHSAPSAKVIAVATDLGKHVAGEVGDAAAQHALKGAAATATLQGRLLETALGEIKDLAQKMEKTTRPKVKQKAAAKLAYKQADKLAAEQALKEAGRLAELGRAARVSLPIIFAAWDVMNAFEDFDETTKGL